MMDCLVLPVYMGDSCFRLLLARRRQAVEEKEDGVQGGTDCIAAAFPFFKVLYPHSSIMDIFTFNTFGSKG